MYLDTTRITHRLDILREKRSNCTLFVYAGLQLHTLLIHIANVFYLENLQSTSFYNSLNRFIAAYIRRLCNWRKFIVYVRFRAFRDFVTCYNVCYHWFLLKYNFQIVEHDRIFYGNSTGQHQ